MKVLIDNREMSTVRLLRKMSECEVVRLPLGDLLIAGDSGALIVERKTVSDFVSSIKSNRLWDQLLRLMKTDAILGYEVKRRLMVIQGGFWEYTNVSSVDPRRFWSSIFGALLEILFVYDTAPASASSSASSFPSQNQSVQQQTSSQPNDKSTPQIIHQKPGNNSNEYT